MLFNSYSFLLGFLPATTVAFFLLSRINYSLAAGWLCAASLFFYGWWNPAYVGLLLGSVLFNYFVGISLARGFEQRPRGRQVLVLGISANLVLLGYFKYADFFIANANALLGTGFGLPRIVLPLGISFFTFTQIAFLVDAYRGEVREYNLIHYGLFVTYFPHLIAGPVLHHKEMMPQFSRPETYRPSYGNFAVGLTIFIIGLFKKVVFADNVAVFATPVFEAAASGQTLTFFEAWGGALAYTLQLYFDFSGYSDMAIGLSRLFGVKLPLNFDSPYKATSIADFWRRWHMTLSRFLRDYLYIALGGNRKGPLRRYANLLITMFLGGLWHGAAWTFVIWGALHGLYLVVNHMWRAFRSMVGQDSLPSTLAGRLSAGALTFFAVVVAWVFFRSQDIPTAWAILKSMFGINGFVFPGLQTMPPAMADWLARIGVVMGNAGPLFEWPAEGMWLLSLLAVVWLMPNTQQLLASFEPALDWRAKGYGHTALQGMLPDVLYWQPSARWALFMAACATVAFLGLSRVSEFIYFEF